MPGSSSGSGSGSGRPLDDWEGLIQRRLGQPRPLIVSGPGPSIGLVQQYERWRAEEAAAQRAQEIEAERAAAALAATRAGAAEAEAEAEPEREGEVDTETGTGSEEDGDVSDLDLNALTSEFEFIDLGNERQVNPAEAHQSSFLDPAPPTLQQSTGGDVSKEYFIHVSRDDADPSNGIDIDPPHDESRTMDEFEDEAFQGPDDDVDEDMLEGVDLEYDQAEDDEDDEHYHDAAPSAPFDPVALGLKEINNLARFRVSTYKPGNGVKELLDDNLNQYWQSDGVQPHLLTLKFTRNVEIRALRFFVDYTQDESYTPIKILWYAGTSEHDLIQFATSTLSNPAGWQDVAITGAGGGEDGNSLCAFVVQMQVAENHQNGKDTHIRGIKIYGFDDQLRAAGATGRAVDDVGFKLDKSKGVDEQQKELLAELSRREFEKRFEPGDASGTASSLDFMEDAVIR